MTASPAIAPAFRDAVRQSQAVFRAAMRAMAAPASIVTVDPGLVAPPPLFTPTAAVLLTLCDFETPIWLDPDLAGSRDAVSFLRFHTGARLVGSPQEAAFAVISDAIGMPSLQQFRQGTPDYPDRAATLIVQLDALGADGWTLEGPGIRGRARLHAAPLPADFPAQLRANRALFPLGVDIFLTTRSAIAALPRSVRLTETA